MWRKVLSVSLAGLALLAGGAELPISPQDLAVRVWNKQQGLPSDSITSVLQTREGYLWIGTIGGLARFDGVRFDEMAASEDPLNTDFHVTALCEDSSGRLWVGTQSSGLLRYGAGTLSRFDVFGKLREDSINSIAEDSAGSIWIGTPSGLTRISQTNVHRFTSHDGLPSDFVSSVHVARRSGVIWITTRGGMCQFKDGRIHPYPFRTDSRGRNPEPLGVYEDRRGHLWAFGDTYLVNVDQERYHLNHFGSGDAPTSARIWSLCEGRRGALWIGTSGKGLYYFADNQFVPVTLRTGGLASDVRAICEDREGNLWLGTDGGGLVRLQPRNMRLFNMEAGLPDRPAVAVAANARGVWAGFDRGGLYQLAGERFRHVLAHGEDVPNLISALCVEPDGAVWIGTPGAGVYHISERQFARYTTLNGLRDDRIRSTVRTALGEILAGTASGGLHRFERGRFTPFDVPAELSDRVATALVASGTGLLAGFDSGEVHRWMEGRWELLVDAPSLATRPVTVLFEDSHGRLWAGTSGGRLGCLVSRRMISWDLNLGSPEHALHGLQMDDEGGLWLSTSAAIYHAAERELNAAIAGERPLRPQLVYRAENGAGTVSVPGWPRSARSPDNRLWFALNSGLASFDLRAATIATEPPPILIEGIAVNDDSLAPAAVQEYSVDRNGIRRAVLPSDLKKLVIHFTALHFNAPEKIRFRYRLDGYDSDWVTSSESARNVPYGRLPHGPYTFRVQAGVDGGSWFDNEASFAFVIPIPIWRTDWAVALYGLTTAGLIGAGVRMVSNRRLRRRLLALSAQQAMERERMRIAQDMHDEIGSKLTKISFMSERAIGELQGHAPVAEKLQSIASTSRDLLQSLDEIVWAVNPHNDTLEHLAAYLGQYATEYLQNTQVQCDLRIQRGLPDCPLSAEIRHNLFLAFEESLNNALKHGQGTLVQIEMGVKGSRFEIRIHDNGRGFNVAEKKPWTAPSGTSSQQRQGNGLRNMNERLSALGGRFEISSEPGHGTTVTFSVPLNGRVSQNRRD